MQSFWDHCFPFGHSTFLWVSSPCDVVHWNSIIAQTSASHQHHFPTCPPPVSLSLLSEHFFPPVTNFFKSSLESFCSSLKVTARYQEKIIPHKQCREGHSSANFKGKPEQGLFDRSSWRQMCKKQLEESHSPSLSPIHSWSTDPSCYHHSLLAAALTARSRWDFFHTQTQRKWSQAVNAVLLFPGIWKAGPWLLLYPHTVQHPFWETAD